jgi:hypothetical protein
MAIRETYNSQNPFPGKTLEEITLDEMLSFAEGIKEQILLLRQIPSNATTVVAQAEVKEHKLEVLANEQELKAVHHGSSSSSAAAAAAAAAASTSPSQAERLRSYGFLSGSSSAAARSLLSGDETDLEAQFGPH